MAIIWHNAIKFPYVIIYYIILNDIKNYFLTWHFNFIIDLLLKNILYGTGK